MPGYDEHMEAKQVRIVAKDEIPTEDFNRTISKVGLKYSRRKTRAASKGFPQHVWHSNRGTVTLVKDEPLELDYIEIDLPNSEDVESLLRNSFPFYQMSEVMDLLRSSLWEDRDQAFRILAEIEYLEYDQELCEIITTSIQDADLDCSDALLAASQLSWRQLRPVVEQAAERHDKSALGDLAWNMLHGSEWDR